MLTYAETYAWSVPTAARALPAESILMSEEVVALEEGSWMAPGTQFTCFTSTKIQILTCSRTLAEDVEEVSLQICLACRASLLEIQVTALLVQKYLLY